MIDLGQAGQQWVEPYKPPKITQDPVQAFLETLSSYGMEPGPIDTSGSMVRFDIDKPGDKAGWYVFYYGDICGAAFGNWKADIKETWCSKGRHEMSDAESAEYQRMVAEAKAKREKLKKELQARAKEKAAKIWDRTQETIAHPYLSKKGVACHGLRQSYNDLVVPVKDENGEIWNLQFIKQDGKGKKFLFGGRVEGCSFTIPGNDQLILCEGYATGATIHKATGATVICAFNAGNLEPVAKKVREKCPNALVTMAGDNDRFTAGNPGLKHAEKAAKAIGAKVVLPVFDGLPGAEDAKLKYSDFNDLEAVGGLELVQAQIATPLKTLSNALLGIDDLLSLEIPPKNYHLLPAIPTSSYGLIAGERGVGKSHLAHAIAIAIANGKDFGPWKCQRPANVMIIDGELCLGDLQERLGAIDRPTGGKRLMLLSDAYVVENMGLAAINLSKPDAREAIRDLIITHSIKVVFFDNVASLTPGIDENVKQEWDPINRWLIGLRYAGVSCWLVHHLGKNGEQRGTSGREDNIDVSIKLTRPRDYVTTDGARFCVSFTKKRVPHKLLPMLEDTEMKYQPDESGRYVWTFGSPEKNTEMEALLLLSSEMKQSVVADELKISKGQVSKLKKKLNEKGYLSSHGLLTAEGKNTLTGAGYEV